MFGAFHEMKFFESNPEVVLLDNYEKSNLNPLNVGKINKIPMQKVQIWINEKPFGTK